MSRPKFDINTGNFIFGDDDFGFDSKGHAMIDIGEDAVMDMTTGDIHFTMGDDFNSLDEE